jgi:hypothetical protein
VLVAADVGTHPLTTNDDDDIVVVAVIVMAMTPATTRISGAIRRLLTGKTMTPKEVLFERRSVIGREMRTCAILLSSSCRCSCCGCLHFILVIWSV